VEKEKQVQDNETKTNQKKFSRRRFLKLTGAATVTTTVAGVLEGCASESSPPRGVIPSTGATLVPIEQQYPEVPYTPDSTPVPSELMFFTPEEFFIVEALTARVLPGTVQDPGAREAGVAVYIDRKLAFDQNNGFVEPTYFKPPFAKLYEGDTPPQKDDEKTVWVKKSEIDRYGFQSDSRPQETYRKNLAAVDQYAQTKFQKKFVDLSEDQQDQLLMDMESGDTQGFEDDNDRVFFTVLRQDTIDGMFADPAYGGNRNMVGWKLIGYPGAQRAYTPVDLHTEGNVRPPQSILQLHKFHPGQLANPDVIVPPSGSDIDQNHQP
jgi:gluconate 2-dehydrogenase gamma chain